MNEEKVELLKGCIDGKSMEVDSVLFKINRRQSYPHEVNSYKMNNTPKTDKCSERKKRRHSDQNCSSRCDKNQKSNSDEHSDSNEGSPKNIPSSKRFKKDKPICDYKIQQRVYSDNSYSPHEASKRLEVIENSGVHILSQTETGESRIFYKPDFIPTVKADKWFQKLLKKVDWSTKNIIVRGVEYPQPRLVAWFGPLPYTYSGITLQPKKFPGIIRKIKKKVEAALRLENINIDLNSVLLNLYRDEKDSVAWHSDDEKSMGICPTIASVSLGEVRRFEMRRTPDISERYTAEPEYLVYLKSGSLIVMDGVMQEDWQHRVPKEYHAKAMRINLTFRTVFPIDRVPKPLAKAGYSRNLKVEISPPKASITQETFELKPDLFPSLSESLPAPQQPKPQRKPEKKQKPTLKSSKLKEKISPPKPSIMQETFESKPDLFPSLSESLAASQRQKSQGKPQKEQKPTTKSSGFENDVVWTCTYITQLLVLDNVETQQSILPPTPLVGQVDQLSSDEEYWDDDDQSSRFSCHQNSKGLNPNADAWDGTGISLSCYPHSEHSTRSHQTGEEIWEDTSPQQTNHQVHNGFRQNGRELRSDEAKSSERYYKEYCCGNDKSSSTKQTETYKDSNVPPRHRYSKTSNQNGQAIQNVDDKSPLRNYNRQSNNSASLSKQNDSSRDCGDEPIKSDEDVKEIGTSVTEFESMVTDMFDVYDYVAKNSKKISSRDQEEVAYLMTIVENSANFPFNIIVKLTDRLRSLSNQNNHGQYGNRSHSSTQLGPRFNKRKFAGRK